MRLNLSALLCAALVASPALAHGDRRHDDGPPPPYGADLPPPPPGYGYGPHGAAPMDPRMMDRGMHGEWIERCGHHDRDGRDGPGTEGRAGCGHPVPYGHAYPGAYIGYAVPMIMVPVMRNKPCKEVVEYIEEVVPVRRRVIPRRVRPAPRVIPDKRLPMDKRVPMAPTKRIPY